MTFVNEEIAAVDQQRIGFEHLRDSGGRAFIPHVWVVDRETGTYLIESYNKDMDFPSESRFVLGWKGHQLHVNAIGVTTGDVASGVHWTWRLATDFRPSLETKAEREAALEVLKAALTTYSNRIHPARTVKFDFQAGKNNDN